MWFCPWDGSLLMVEQGAIQIQFLCPVCPYKHSITQKHKVQVTTVRKKTDDVMGGNKAWENVDKTAHVCPACNHNEAYFMQMQIRSADEPMSVFYKCCKCGHRDTER
uniref:DNA-directed RNA polymerase subunit n=1 Tax=Florenciella parvula TaxID=236787 RepID=A0A7S2BFC9_9STRA|mmetsp:Transcript_16287/g.33997  ORF Transcript_16287/g.33997 Transcript_16287/m.33997 type:complete len:107 (+) Transcript_16287:112-432(+)